jgi:hypothetical protein
MSTADVPSAATGAAPLASTSAELESQAVALTAEKERNAQLELKIAALTGENSKLHAQSAHTYERDAKRLRTYQPDIEQLVKEVSRSAENDETLKDAISGFDVWAGSYANAAPGLDMQKHNSIATVSALASKRIQTLTKEASVGAEASAALAEKSQLLEEAETKLSALQTQLEGADKLNTSLNATLKDQTQLLHRYGLVNTPASTDFNLPVAREQEVAKSVTPTMTSNASAGAAGAQMPAMGQLPVLTAIEATASKGPSSSSSSASNVHMDPLLAELQRRCAAGDGGGGRVMPSGTQHPHVGMAGLATSSADIGLPADVLAVMGGV